MAGHGVSHGQAASRGTGWHESVSVSAWVWSSRPPRRSDAPGAARSAIVTAGAAGHGGDAAARRPRPCPPREAAGGGGGADDGAPRRDSIAGDQHSDPPRTVGERGVLQPTVGRDGPGPVPVVREAPRAEPGAPQPAHERVGVLALHGRGHRPPRPSALLERPGQARPQPPPAGHPAGPGRLHPAVPGPARPHAIAGPRQQGVHPAGGQRPRAPHPWADEHASWTRWTRSDSTSWRRWRTRCRSS